MAHRKMFTIFWSCSNLIHILNQLPFSLLPHVGRLPRLKQEFLTYTNVKLCILSTVTKSKCINNLDPQWMIQIYSFPFITQSHADTSDLLKIPYIDSLFQDEVWVKHTYSSSTFVLERFPTGHLLYIYKTQTFTTRGYVQASRWSCVLFPGDKI